MNTDLCLAQETYISASKVLRRTATFESRVDALSRGFAASSGFMPASVPSNLTSRDFCRNDMAWDEIGK